MSNRLTIREIRDFIAYNISGSENLIYSNFIDRNSDKSIGIFSGPESRASKVETLGGDKFATTKVYPANIIIRWTEDSDVCEARAVEFYDMLNEFGDNFPIRLNDSLAVQVAFIQMLDEQPVWLGRTNDNVCEFIIRINIHYYCN